MIVTVNGKPHEIEERATVARLLESQRLQSTPCAVEVNKSLVPRKRHPEHALREGDRIEIVTLVGGG